MTFPTTGPGGPPRLDSAALLDGLADAVVIADLSGNIVYVNPSACRLLETPASDLTGAPLVQIIPERLRPAHTTGWTRFLQSRVAHLVGRRPVRLPALRQDGTEVEVELSLSLHTATDGRELLVGTLRDLGDRVELERQRQITTYLATSRDIMSRLALGTETATMDDAAPILLQTLSSGLGWDGGAVWQQQADQLTPIAVWPDTPQSVPRLMTEGVRLRPGQGLPGQVAGSGVAAWIETVSDAGVFVRQEHARRAQVRSCFAFPIMVADEIVGVAEMYSRAEQAPQPELLAILETAGREIGRYLERVQSRRHLVELAEALQASLLPPLSPSVPGLDLAVRYRSAGGAGLVGGDFFDVFPLPDGEWVILIGDVSGRGPRAAALTALARYTLRAAAVGAGPPSSILAILNEVVLRELETSSGGEERFLTVAYLTISPSPTGFAVRAACGGHPYPLARRADGSVEEVVCEGDLIGAFAVHDAADVEVSLGAGDVMLLVTDGVIEARGDSDEFGHDRLRDVLAATANEAASEIADAIEAAVLAHLGGHPQDDLAIVVVRHPPRLDDGTSIDVEVATSDAAR